MSAKICIFALYSILFFMVRLSIVIATYNRSALLIQTLQSIVEQTFPRTEWECVVVNNNSSDDTASAFEKFAEQYSDYNLRMVLEPNQGLSHCWQIHYQLSYQGSPKGACLNIIKALYTTNPQLSSYSMVKVLEMSHSKSPSKFSNYKTIMLP